MKYDFVVIGANGIQGRIVSRYLLEDGHNILLCANDDYGIEELIEHPKAEFALIDLRRMDRVKRVVKKSGSAIVVNCAVDDFNLAVTKMALDLGMNYIDLGSEEPMYLDQKKLDEDFKAKGLLGVVGIGSTPGVTNIMLQYAKPKFDTIDTVHVGFAWDSNIPKFIVPFSIDAIEWEFTKKAKILEDGVFVEKEINECKVDYYYKSIGKQRTIYAIHMEPVTFYEFLKDKGVKNISRMASYPPHAYVAIKTLLELGLLKREPLDFHDFSARPLDVSAEILRRIEIPEGYAEKENLFLKIFGTKDGQPLTIEMDCVAGTLTGWETATCNIDTGFPAAILAKMILNNQIPDKGIFSPEFVVPWEPFFKALGERKIWIYENDKKINGPDSSSGNNGNGHAANGNGNGDKNGKEKTE